MLRRMAEMFYVRLVGWKRLQLLGEQKAVQLIRVKVRVTTYIQGQKVEMVRQLKIKQILTLSVQPVITKKAIVFDIW